MNSNGNCSWFLVPLQTKKKDTKSIKTRCRLSIWLYSDLKKATKGPSSQEVAKSFSEAKAVSRAVGTVAKQPSPFMSAPATWQTDVGKRPSEGNTNTTHMGLKSQVPFCMKKIVNLSHQQMFKFQSKAVMRQSLMNSLGMFFSAGVNWYS